jgi:hypothetical protein
MAGNFHLPQSEGIQSRLCITPSGLAGTQCPIAGQRYPEQGHDIYLPRTYWTRFPISKGDREEDKDYALAAQVAEILLPYQAA